MQRARVQRVAREEDKHHFITIITTPRPPFRTAPEFLRAGEEPTLLPPHYYPPS
jgi:hypothetical protein